MGTHPPCPRGLELDRQSKSRLSCLGYLLELLHPLLTPSVSLPEALVSNGSFETLMLVFEGFYSLLALKFFLCNITIEICT